VNKKEIREKIYRQVVLNKRNHQELFDTLETSDEKQNLQIAEEISIYPTPELLSENKGLLILYYILLSILMLLRVYDYTQLYLTDANFLDYLFTTFFDFIIPAFAIYIALKQKYYFNRLVAYLLGFSLLKAILSQQFTAEFGLISMIPHVGAIIFTLFLAKSMRVDFKTIASKEDLDVKKIIFDCAPNERFEARSKDRRLRRDFD
jgi:hypothetical protein